MNSLYPEKMIELNRKKAQAEIAAIRLGEEAANGEPKWIDKNVATLGQWMVDKGEKLRKRSAASVEKGSNSLAQGSA
jgi:hypothetical protein